MLCRHGLASRPPRPVQLRLLPRPDGLGQDDVGGHTAQQVRTPRTQTMGHIDKDLLELRIIIRHGCPPALILEMRRVIH